MPTVWKWAVVGLWIGATSVALGQESKSRKEFAAESYEIYSAVFSQHYGSWFKGKDPVVIYPYTVLEPQGHQGGNCRERAKDVKVVQDLLEQLISEKEEFHISPKLRLPGKYQMAKGRAQIRGHQEPGMFSCPTSSFLPIDLKRWCWLETIAEGCAALVLYGSWTSMVITGR